MDRHNGREGNVRLINGTSEPEFAIAAGQIQRWRIVNAASARYIRLSLLAVSRSRSLAPTEASSRQPRR